MSIAIVTPGSPVVSLADAKAHLRVDHTDDDALITTLIAVATEHFAQTYDRAIGVNTWLWKVEYDPCRGTKYLALPYSPVTSITAVRYLDGTNTLVAYSASLYELIEYANDHRQYLRFTDPAKASAVTQVEFAAGEAAIPVSIAHAIKMVVTRLYEHRGELVDFKMNEDRAIAALMSPFRWMFV